MTESEMINRIFKYRKSTKTKKRNDILKQQLETQMQKP